MRDQLSLYFTPKPLLGEQGRFLSAVFFQGLSARICFNRKIPTIMESGWYLKRNPFPFFIQIYLSIALRGFDVQKTGLFPSVSNKFKQEKN